MLRRDSCGFTFTTSCQPYVVTDLDDVMKEQESSRSHDEGKRTSKRRCTAKQVVTETNILLKRYAMEMPLSCCGERVEEYLLLTDFEEVSHDGTLVAHTGAHHRVKNGDEDNHKTWDEDETWYLDVGYDGRPCAPDLVGAPTVPQGSGFHFDKGFSPENPAEAARFRLAARRLVSLLAA